MANSYAAAVAGASTISGTASTNASSSSTTMVSTIDSNHPFYIQNSDNPGIPLVTQLLTEQNYHQRSRSISIALSAKMKLGMIDGSLVKPSNDTFEYPLWVRCNDMVVSWLLNSISTEIRNSVAYFSTAKQIWDDLAIRFSQSNLPRIFQLRKELASMHQGNMPITSYFTKYRTLMAEIDCLSPIPKCVCVNSNCACENAQKLEKYEDMVKLSQFLMGLGDQYTAVRGQLLMMRPTPTLNHAFSLLLQEESQREFANSVPPISENMAMNVRFNNKFKPFNPTGNVQKRASNDHNVLCEFCQNPGHLKDKCFYLHGYPEWHKLYGKPKPKLKRPMNTDVKAVAQVSAKGTQGPPIDYSANSSKDSNITLSEVQCQQIVKMLQDKMTPSSSGFQLSGPYPDEGERDW
ncbi:uncharacterized protein LOC141677941 [Apium graveolens]|uniref:uncharacterized protein LOC141677941 n=1 Tax=Apium graveolens TaxID=4045 RepID=UPI003D7BD4E8